LRSLSAFFALAATTAHLVIQAAGTSGLPGYILGFAMFTLILTVFVILLSTINDQTKNSNAMMHDHRSRRQRTNKRRCRINNLNFMGLQTERVVSVVQAKTVGFIGAGRRPVGFSMQFVCSACDDSSNELVMVFKESIHEHNRR